MAQEPLGVAGAGLPLPAHCAARPPPRRRRGRPRRRASSPRIGPSPPGRSLRRGLNGKAGKSAERMRARARAAAGESAGGAAEQARGRDSPVRRNVGAEAEAGGAQSARPLVLPSPRAPTVSRRGCAASASAGTSQQHTCAAAVAAGLGRPRPCGARRARGGARGDEPFGRCKKIGQRDRGPLSGCGRNGAPRRPTRSRPARRRR